MTTYKSYLELQGELLEQHDAVFIGKFKYIVGGNHLMNYSSDNGAIFDFLKLNKHTVADECYGYENRGGGWPEAHGGDYHALTRLVLYLFKRLKSKLSWKERMKND